MLSGIRDAVLIYNPLAGGGHRRREQHIEEARRILAAAGIDAEPQPTQGPSAATELARRAVERGRQLVIVCGGDGTVNEAVNGLAGSQVPLAVLPAGTANVLAKELGIPRNIPRAAALIPRSSLRRIALGLAASLPARVPQRYFLCVAGAGPDGVLIYSVKTEQKVRMGILAYWQEGLRQIIRYRFPRFRIFADGKEAEGTLVVVGRTRHYGGPFCITTGASLFEDSFELAVCTLRRGWGYLSYLPAATLGQLRRMPGMEYFKARTVRCEPLSNEPVYAQVDGEPAGRVPIEFTIVPDAITLVVPER